MALIDKIIESPSLVWVMEIKRSRDVTAHSISAVYNTMSTTTGSSSSTIVESRNWLDLPDDVTAKILVKLGAVEIMETVQFVCVSWWRRLWRPCSLFVSRGGGYARTHLCGDAFA
ncbi:hypothetical protein ACFE04_030256 [Oxalis oulophora]